MRIPRTPPPSRELFERHLNLGNFERIHSHKTPLANGKYLHWDELRRRKPPAGFSMEEWWLALKMNRDKFMKSLPLLDKLGNAFNLAVVDPIPEHLHKIDRWAGGRIEAPSAILNEDTRDRYYVSSLIEEAITSSQLEGAATTRHDAQEMIRQGRKPRDRSEQMILNNYQTMRRIRALKDEPLTKELVFEIHRGITEDTLDEKRFSGCFRTEDDNIRVQDIERDEILHVPPSARELEDRMKKLCAFANDESPGYFIHPALRAIILHFWLAYDHPFVDGNGRTARALFYWAMLKYDFWLFEYISVSHIFLKAPSKYARAYLYSETDDNDMTYFVLHHLRVIERAMTAMQDYIARKEQEARRVERTLKKTATLNHRQRALLSHALRHPSQHYTIDSHMVSHDVAYQTARTDLLYLKDKGLLEQMQIGRRFFFTPIPELETKLGELG